MYSSNFGGIWVDRNDFGQVLAEKVKKSKISERNAELISEIATKGYAVIPQAVPHDVIDAFNEEISHLDERSEHLVGRSNQGYTIPTSEQVSNGRTRILDIHATSALARSMIFNESCSSFLHQYFDAPAIAFQTLLFTFGSQQAIHQDPAYVVVNNPLDMVASWLALEDVEEGTGELVYLEGSHKAEDFMFSNEHKHWKQSRDGSEQHQEFLGRLAGFQESKTYETRRFLARKGDVLFWHADLAHGGSRVTKPNRTRKSLVTHFCSVRSQPNFATYASHLYHTIDDQSGHKWCSRHYNLKLEEHKIADGTLTPAFMGHKFVASEKTFDATQLLDRTTKRPGTSVTQTGDELILKSDSKDPGVLMDLDLNSATETYEITVDMTSQDAGIAQLFFKKSGQESFTEQQSKQVKFDSGRERLMFRIGQVMPGSEVRFDPSRDAGTFQIHSIECKWIA